MSHIKEALFFAAEYGDAVKLKSLISKENKYLYLNVGRTREEQDSLIICAAREGSTECVKVLIEEKANVDKRTRTGSSALHYACVYNHTDCVDVLIEARAQVNGRDHRKATPVMFAAMKGNVGIINTLVQAGADVTMRTEDKKSALDWAQEYNRVDTISVLEREMKKRQDENENDENGSDVKETGNDDADGDDNGDDTGDGGGQDNHSDHVDGVVAGDQSQQNVKKVRFDSRCQTSDGDSVSVSPASASKHSAMSRVVGEGRGGKGGGMDWEAMLTGGIGAVMGMGMSAGKSVSELCMDGAGGLTVATHSDVHKSMAGADGKCISSHTSHNTDHGDYDDDIPQLDDNDLDVVNLKTKMSSSSRPTSTPPPALQASSSPPAWSYAALSMPLPSSSPSRIAQCFLRLCMQESAVKHRVQSRTEKGDREARDGLCELDFLSMVMARREMDPAFCVDDIMLFLKARKDFLSDVKRYGKDIALAVLWDLENYDIEKLGEQERNKKIAKLINAQKITK